MITDRASAERNAVERSESAAERARPPARQVRREGTRGTGRDGGPPAARLQRRVGNRALQRAAERGAEPGPANVQTGGPAERAADEAATAATDATTDESGDEIELGSRSRTLGGTGSGAVGISGPSPVALLGTGRPLPASERSEFERRFGRNFGDVRLHTGPDADRAASSVGALAFASGRDVAFARGAYRPDAPEGRELLAHELAHVVQQSRLPTAGEVVQRRADPRHTRPDRLERRDWQFLDPSHPDLLSGIGRREAGREGERRLHGAVESARDQAATEHAEGRATERAEAVGETATGTTDFLERVKEAADTATREWFDEHVPPVYHADPDAGVDAWVDAIWTRLGLAGIPRSPDDEALQRAIDRLDLQRNVTDALHRRFRSIHRTAGTDEFEAEVATFLGDALAEAPPGSTGALTDRVWRDLLECGSIDALPRRVRWLAEAARDDVRDAMGAGYTGWAGETAGDTPATDDGELRGAVADALRSRSSWVDTPGELSALLDEAAAEVGLVQPTERTHPAARGGSEDAIARSGLDEAGNRLLAAAEVDLLREALPSRWAGDLTPETWLRGRPNYLADLSVPLWTYYADYVESFRFLGRQIPKQNGLHRDLAALLPDVEETMLEAAGSRYERVEDLEFRPRFYGFRFQPLDHGPGKGKLSRHGTARAFDMMARENPFFRGETMTLASVVGGTWLHELSQSRRELSQLAAEQRPLLDRRRELRRELEAADDEATRARLRRELSGVQTEVDRVHGSERARSLVSEATTIRSQLVRAQQRLGRRWPRYRPGMDLSDIESLADLLDATVEAWRRSTDGPSADQDGPVADFPELVALVDGYLRREREAVEAAADDRSRRVHEERVEKLESLRSVLASPSAARTDLIRTGSRITPGVAELAAGGITNQPAWMIRAFTRHGWSWGGAWHSLKDSMHFDYMGPLDGVR